MSTEVSFVRIDSGNGKLPQDNRRVSSSVFQRSPIIVVVRIGCNRIYQQSQAQKLFRIKSVVDGKTWLTHTHITHQILWNIQIQQNNCWEGGMDTITHHLSRSNYQVRLTCDTVFRQKSRSLLLQQVSFFSRRGAAVKEYSIYLYELVVVSKRVHHTQPQLVMFGASSIQSSSSSTHTTEQLNGIIIMI